MKNLISKIKKAPPILFEYIHFFFFGYFFYHVSKLMAKSCYIKYHAAVHYDYVRWTRLFYDITKPYQLSFFVFFTSLLAIYLVCIFLSSVLIQKKFTKVYSALTTPDESKSGTNVFLLFVSLVFVLTVKTTLIGTIIWIVALISISYLLYNPRFKIEKISLYYSKSEKPISVLLFVFMLFALFYTIIPMMNGKHFIFNEFIELSEKTKIENNYYDNISFVKNNLSYPKFNNIKEVFADSSYERVKMDRNIEKWYKQVENNSINSQFINKNLFSFQWQIYNRSFDLHNNQVLNPVNAWMLGVPFKKTTALYGFLNSWIVKTWFSITKEFSYKRWFQFAYFIYVLYFILLFLSSLYLFRSFSHALAVFAIAMILVIFKGYLGYFYLVIGQIPINPIRHFFDVFVLFFMVMSFRKKDILSRLGVIIFCYLSVLNADNFGIFLCIATMVIFIIKYFKGEENYYLMDLITPFLIFVGMWMIVKLSPTIQHPGAKYFIDGFFSFPIKLNHIGKFSGMYFLLFFYLVYRGVTKCFSLSLASILWSSSYYYLLMSHYFWHGVSSDMIVALPIYAIFIVSLLVFISKDLLGLSSKYFNTSLLLVVSIFALTSYSHFLKTKSSYLDIEKNHLTHTWMVDRAKIFTSMPEQPIRNAIKLIDKYDKNKNYIYMISKYDYYLPVLAKKYTDLIYPNLPWFIVSSTDRNKIIEQLKNKKPQILFVDTDIDLNNQLWTVNNYMTLKNENLFIENRYRLLRLFELKLIFDQIKSDYQLIEKGDLISAYRRR